MAQLNELAPNTTDNHQGRLAYTPSELLPPTVVGPIFDQAQEHSLVLRLGEQIPVSYGETVILLAGVLNVVINGGFQIIGEVTTWPGRITAALAGLFQAGFQAGAQLVQGFINGIGSLIGSAIAKAQELASSVKNAVTGFLGIHSPSRVMHEVGQFTGQGFADGLESQKEKITNVAADIAKSVKDQFGVDLPALGQKGLDTAFGFGEANFSQLKDDLGIGGGAITAALDQGLQIGKQMLGNGLTQIFNTSNVDDTIAVKNNQLNKQALGVVGKSG
ncbi:phage tail protein [Mycobacteroides abscessus]|uniref:phage tail protein n=1 Tax=Mycobacteroides abscessus TaxID=36809 RepID=UPI0009271D35|nr:hypothetical protein [Mycobacteroides abscessus]SIF73679.1 Phage-related protein [Mycobacteroides abscessus subsp. abscessus]